MHIEVAEHIGSALMEREKMSDVKITREYVSFDEAVPKPNKNLVEVVRCKECGFAFYKEGLVPEGYIFCTKPGTERGQAVKPDDWFCADGEKSV